MPTLLLADALPWTDPSAPSLLMAAQAHLPPGWTAVAVPKGETSRRYLRSAAAVAFVGVDLASLRQRRLAGAIALTLDGGSTGRRVALVGVRAASVRPGPTRRLVRVLAERSDLLVLADEPSAEILVADGLPGPLRVGSDPAWAAFAAASPKLEQRDTVTVTIGAEPPPLDLLSLLRRLAADGLELALQPWERVAGAATRRAETLIDALDVDARLLPPVDDLGEARRRFETGRLVVADQPHALIAAAAAGIPMVATAAKAAREPTTRGELVAAAGNGAPLDRLAATTLDRDAVDEAINAARETFRLLRLLLSEGVDGTDQIGPGTRLAPEPRGH